MIKKYTIGQLQALEFDITVLRACPGIPFSLVNDLNGNLFPIKEAIKKHLESIEVLKDRSKEIENLKDEAKVAAETALNKDFITLQKREYSVDVEIFNVSQFKNCQIDGVKEVKQPDNSVEKFLYRDAYFDLLNEIIVSEKEEKN